MVNHPVLQAIQILWRNLYHDLLIVDTAKFYKGDIPYHAENITELINSCCKITRDVNFLFINFFILLWCHCIRDFAKQSQDEGRWRVVRVVDDGFWGCG